MTSQHFDRVYCINLDRRADRWERFKSNIEAIGWSDAPIHRFSATDGWQPDTPGWWGAGGGAWGCFDSHRRILRSCVLDDIQSVLIFEDDAALPLDFHERLKTFMGHLPDDWECIYLGGQLQHTHKHRPQVVNSEVLRPYNANRTHAYAFRNEGITKTLAYLEDFSDWSKYPKDHIDHRLGRIHETRGLTVYCPTEWIVAQGENKSDIDGRTHGHRLWPIGNKVEKRPPAIARDTGKIRVGAWYPNLVMGGAEVWLRSLLTGLDREKFHIAGVTLDQTAPVDRSLPFGDIPVDVDRNTLLENVDVMIVWAVRNIRQIRRYFKGPIVCISHGGCQWSRNMIAKLSDFSTHYTAVSEYCRGTYPPALQASVKVIPNGVDLDRVVPTAERWELRQCLGIRDQVAIGYVGRMSKEKDPLAAARAVSAMPNAVAVYCGPDTGNYRKEIERLCGDRLRWTGPMEQVSDVYGALDVLLLTSESEGFSLAAAEAWAAGVPVVASNVGAMQMFPGFATIVPTGADGPTLKAAIEEATSPRHRNTVEQLRILTREFLSTEAMCENWGTFLEGAVKDYVYTGSASVKPPKRVVQPGILRPKKIPRP